eukprot:m.163893 g.163893  ORF g.163893 m.163893 type:complete len:64 (-) comp23931_c0_seq1:798-989(-)
MCRGHHHRISPQQKHEAPLLEHTAKGVYAMGRFDVALPDDDLPTHSTVCVQLAVVSNGNSPDE